MRRSFAAMLSCVVVATFLQSSLLAADGVDSWSEKWVTVVEPDQSVAVGQYPPLSARVEVGDNFDILRSDGTSLWVGRGWLPASEAIPYDKAIEFFSAQIARKPSPATYNLRATVYLKRADFKSAVTDANEALRRDPHFAPALRIRGVANSELGNRKLGLADLDEAIRCDPNFGEAYRSRGDVYRKSKDWDRAIAEYTSAIRLNPRDSKAFYNRGQAWLAKGSLDKAVSDMNDAVRRDPTDPEAYLSEYSQPSPTLFNDAAIPGLAQSGKVSPAGAYRMVNRMVGYVHAVNNKDFDRAIAEITALVVVTGNGEPAGQKPSEKEIGAQASAGLLTLRGVAWHAKGLAKRGLSAYSELSVLHGTTRPEIDHGFVPLGTLEDEHALADFDEAIRRAPDYPKVGLAYATRSDIRLRRGQLADALADAENAVRVSEKDQIIECYIRRAEAESKLKSFDRALADVDAAIRLEPSEARFHGWRAAVLLEAGDARRAVASANEAIRLERRAADHHVLRGCARRATGDDRGALQDFSEAVKLDATAEEAWKQQAWTLATSSDPEIRKADLAIKAAQTACSLSGCRDPDALQTLAASYAEKGDFHSAVAWQMQAESLFFRLVPERMDIVLARRRMYVANQPCRDLLITR